MCTVHIENSCIEINKKTENAKKCHKDIDTQQKNDGTHWQIYDGRGGIIKRERVGLNMIIIALVQIIKINYSPPWYIG